MPEGASKSESAEQRRSPEFAQAVDLMRSPKLLPPPDVQHLIPNT
ncbi:hypothetical protein [Microcoleus sp. FACHB-1515]|nr:hypothetical protein [Microcoleus sp. FACHB-1515]